MGGVLILFVPCPLPRCIMRYVFDLVFRASGFLGSQRYSTIISTLKRQICHITIYIVLLAEGYKKVICKKDPQKKSPPKKNRSSKGLPILLYKVKLCSF